MKRSNTQDETGTNHLALGATLGAALGIVLGVVFGIVLDNMAFMGTGIAIGMGTGLVIGMGLEQKNNQDE